MNLLVQTLWSLKTLLREQMNTLESFSFVKVEFKVCANWYSGKGNIWGHEFISTDISTAGNQYEQLPHADTFHFFFKWKDVENIIRGDRKVFSYCSNGFYPVFENDIIFYKFIIYTHYI